MPPSRNGRRSSFSNYGDRLDVSAPGEQIDSLLPGSRYGTKSGTSMAAPYVAGEAALIVAAHPDWTPAQVRQQIDRAVNVMSVDGWDPNVGYGEVNLFKAVYGTNLPVIARVAKPAEPTFWQKLLAVLHLG